MRKRHTPAFKAQIVAQALKEEKTLAQLASENGLHPNQISAWKATALNGLVPISFRCHEGSTMRLKCVCSVGYTSLMDTGFFRRGFGGTALSARVARS